MQREQQEKKKQYNKKRENQFCFVCIMRVISLSLPSTSASSQSPSERVHATCVLIEGVLLTLLLFRTQAGVVAHIFNQSAAVHCPE